MIAKVALGDTGIVVSELAFGTGTHGWSMSSEQTRLGKGAFIELLVYGYERGISFWDLADQYGSHPHANEALKQIGRENVVLTTKTCASTKKEAEQDLARFLDEIGTDHLEIVLLHCMTGTDWPKARAGAMEALAEAKEKGLIRVHGVSCHDLPALKVAAECPWVDVLLARINHRGCSMDGSVPDVIDTLASARAHGKALYAMKTLGVGELTAEVPRALAYVRSLPFIDALSVGMKSREEIDQNVGLFDEPAT